MRRKNTVHQVPVRQDPNSNTHTISVANDVNAAGDWLQAHGQAAVHCGGPGSFYPGVAFRPSDSKNMLARIAVPGDTLVFDQMTGEVIVQ